MLGYGAFIRHRKAFWDEFAGLLDGVEHHSLRILTTEEVERFASLYHACLSDYAYAGSHFPGTQAHGTLSGLVLKGAYHLGIRHGKGLGGLGVFFARDYPGLVKAHRPFILVALAVFSFFVVWGALITLLHPGFAAFFLGTETYEGLVRGEFWVETITGLLPPSVMATGIWINNVSVSVLAWGLGALWGIGTLYLLAVNGLMLGALLQAAATHNMLDRLLLFITAHGILEVFLLITVCGAGLLMGWGFINPERMEWRDSVQARASAGFKIAAGTFPWFILLAMVEGYISPRTDWPMAFHVTLGLALFGAYLVYGRWHERA